MPANRLAQFTRHTSRNVKTRRFFETLESRRFIDGPLSFNVLAPDDGLLIDNPMFAWLVPGRLAPVGGGGGG
jgi:hypothetical protein